MEPEELMGMAIGHARLGIHAGQSPFGCAIAMDGAVVSLAHNTVLKHQDITAHAEINALRQATKLSQQLHLHDAVVATTCEPCPMCMAALHWARVETVYYGATIADAEAAGFNELRLPAAKLLKIGGSSIRLKPGVLSGECRQLFELWQQRPDRVAY